MTDIITIALNKLDTDPMNVRKTYSKEGIEELAANIRNDGYQVLQNLVVRKSDKKGRFLVIAGERRRLALNLLAEAGEITKDFAVECKEREGDKATEISLAENLIRRDMHPLDAQDAFASLAEKGMPIADIAARFGTTETIVSRRLALARVSPVLRELYRDEEISLEQLSAFTVTDDHVRQEEVWNSLPSWNRSAHRIRDALQRGSMRATDKRLVFIGGLEAYEAAGGNVQRDLFDTGNSGYATDIALVERLVAEKLNSEAEKVSAEGWLWVECHAEMPNEAHRLRRVYRQTIPLTEEQQAELDRLDEEYSELAALIEDGDVDDEQESRFDQVVTQIETLQAAEECYAPEDISRAGAYVCIDHYGKLRIERGFIRPEPSHGDDHDDTATDSEESNDSASGKASIAKPFTLSAALTQELTAQKTAAIRAELAHNPDVALVAVVHAMLLSVQGIYGSEETCLELRLTSDRLENSIKDPAECKGMVALDDLAENYGHQLPGNPADLWNWCLDQTREELLRLLAFAAAKSVNALQLPHYNRSNQRRHADKLATALKVDMTDWFPATAANYFGRVSKAGIEEALTEAKGGDFASGVAGMKKAEAAAYAERQIGGTGWLPGPVRIADLESRQAEDDDSELMDAAE
ncbi:ParB/RepB/Spo0J family partition protein [Rhizobium multihospitium]|uniref:Chromosome partitioning protein, ParB family n=1 Tax=Rhizobium multihospitium TaxID=410764 RepID=A0A1C3XB66_9HYPH|nr:ParB/RepB/Spo0J family partition protein [Rhizobium multihospitium]SCB49449.1 chromosome partitioning protein, ParB family [Rhizobium multihospitium]